MDYKIVEASSPEDFSRIDKFIDDHFVPDMPLIQMFGLDDKPPPPPSAAPPRSAQQEGDFVLMAVDAHGAIVGVAKNKQTIQYEVEPDASPELKKMIEFLEWAERDARLDTLPEKTIELRVLAVHRSWRRLGVATRLAEESARLAGERGWRAVRVCCTSEYTARLARALGWRQHYRLRYTDYPATLVLAPVPPHTCIYYYVAEL